MSMIAQMLAIQKSIVIINRIVLNAVNFIWLKIVKNYPTNRSSVPYVKDSILLAIEYAVSTNTFNQNANHILQ